MQLHVGKKNEKAQMLLKRKQKARKQEKEKRDNRSATCVWPASRQMRLLHYTGSILQSIDRIRSIGAAGYQKNHRGT